MQQRYILKVLFVFLALMICLTSIQAQIMPPILAPPIMLKAALSDGGKVQMAWELTRDTATVKYYFIYRATVSGILLAFPDSARFTRIDSVTTREYTDLPPRPTNATMSMSYAYYVTGTTTKGTVLKSNFVVVTLLPTPVPKDVVQITSTPNEVGLIKVEYQYQMKAVSSDPTAVLRYFLNVKPTGMTVDTVTGLIKWTPSVQGFVTVEAGAKSNKGGMATQRYTIRVAGGSGIVVGTVTDTTVNSTPISQVAIHLYKLELTPSPVGASASYDYKTVSDSLGKFKFDNVDPGTYYVRAEPTNSTYLAQWYDNASSLQSAKAITVSDKASTEVNIKLRMRYKPPTYTIKGLVVDTLKRSPVKDAAVNFVVAGFALNGSRGFGADPTNAQDFRSMFDMDPSSDFRLDGTNTQFVFKTKTDASGQFSLTLPAGSYIAYAEAVGYLKMFYNQKTNLLTADTIQVKADRSDFRFPLTPIPQVVLGEINGLISDSATGKGVRSRVIAFRDLWIVNARLNPVAGIYVPGSYVVDTDSLGKYSIVNVVPGSYYVLAMPVGSYAPAFYNASGGTQYWSKAQSVPISGNVAAGIDIKVKPLSKPIVGYTYVSGSVNASSGSGRLGKTSGSIGLMGAIVYAVNSSGDIYGYDVTDQNGSYAITGVAPGSYSLFVDAPGYTSTQSMSASPTYDAKGTPQPGSNVNFTLGASTVTSVEESQPLVPSGYVLEQNYPNPFNPTTQILFSLPNSERVSLTIYNLLGQKIASLVDGVMAAGSHVVTWNGKDSYGVQLPSGIYFYRLESSNFTAAKRMLMLK